MLPPFMLYIITRGISYCQVLFLFSASSKPPGPFIAQKAKTEGDQFRLVKSLFHFSREIKLKFLSFTESKLEIQQLLFQAIRIQEEVFHSHDDKTFIISPGFLTAIYNGEITKEEYDQWRYNYPKYDTYSRRVKVPSQEISNLFTK